mmetsp:Transcript_21176/g.60748  ORF Transcript_21176/g.60748 Transcript_21176/m.60748 type:complete len:441 (+) Transcript_21176:95-1417(+)
MYRLYRYSRHLTQQCSFVSHLKFWFSPLVRSSSHTPKPPRTALALLLYVVVIISTLSSLRRGKCRVRRDDSTANLGPVGREDEQQQNERNGRITDDDRGDETNNAELQLEGEDGRQGDADAGNPDEAVHAGGNSRTGLGREDGPRQVADAHGTIAGADQHDDVAQYGRDGFVIREQCYDHVRLPHEHGRQCRGPYRTGKEGLVGGNLGHPWICLAQMITDADDCCSAKAFWGLLEEVPDRSCDSPSSDVADVGSVKRQDVPLSRCQELGHAQRDGKPHHLLYEHSIRQSSKICQTSFEWIQPTHAADESKHEETKDQCRCRLHPGYFHKPKVVSYYSNEYCPSVENVEQGIKDRNLKCLPVHTHETTQGAGESVIDEVGQSHDWEIGGGKLGDVIPKFKVQNKIVYEYDPNAVGWDRNEHVKEDGKLDRRPSSVVVTATD